MKIKPVAKGHARQWLKCKTCERPAYYDYIPYSLSNPILTTECGHGIGISNTVEISADEALALIVERTSANQ